MAPVAVGDVWLDGGEFAVEVLEFGEHLADRGLLGDGGGAAGRHAARPSRCVVVEYGDTWFQHEVAGW